MKTQIKLLKALGFISRLKILKARICQEISYVFIFYLDQSRTVVRNTFPLSISTHMLLVLSRTMQPRGSEKLKTFR